MRLFHREAHACKINPRDDVSIEISCRADAPLWVAPGTNRIRAVASGLSANAEKRYHPRQFGADGGIALQ
jgi:hypothetical protein